MNAGTKGKRAKKQETIKEEIASEFSTLKLSTLDPVKQEDYTDQELKDMCEEGEIMKLTAKKLKELCLVRGIDTKSSTTKRKLIKALEDHFEK